MRGQILLVGRLALRDLRRRRTEAALLLLAIVAATTALTLGLVVRDAASDPYQSTREATNGPDVLAVVRNAAALPDLEGLAGAPGVIDHSGPYPVAPAHLRAYGRAVDVQVVGRDAVPTSVDQPALIHGGWVRDGGVVVEAAFAQAIGLRVGDRVTVEDRSFDVVGIAVTAAMAPYPGGACIVAVGCASGATAEQLAQLPAGVLQNPGLVWLTEADTRDLGPDSASPSYVMNLRLADPAGARSFVDARLPESRDAPGLESWQDIQAEATEQGRDAQILLMIGAWLLGLLAVASVSVLVGGRMADQTRRVGLLKAAGGTPGLVAAVLLAEYLLVAVVAAGIGLAVGSLTAPMVAGSTAGLVGTAGIPSITIATVGWVMAAALGVAVLGAFVPAVRAARSSTIDALADAARVPRRIGWLVAISGRLPVPLLLAARVAARRPRRTVLGLVGIAITVSGIYFALVLNTFLTDHPVEAGGDPARAAQLRQVLLVVIAVLLCLAAVNAVAITWATALDNRQSSALARALGATPGQVNAALAAAQVLPALVGAILGVYPGGFALFHAIIAITGGDSGRAALPPLWQLVALVMGTVLVVAALTAVPARIDGHRAVTEALE